MQLTAGFNFCEDENVNLLKRNGYAHPMLSMNAAPEMPTRCVSVQWSGWDCNRRCMTVTAFKTVVISLLMIRMICTFDRHSSASCVSHVSTVHWLMPPPNTNLRHEEHLWKSGIRNSTPKSRADVVGWARTRGMLSKGCTNSRSFWEINYEDAEPHKAGWGAEVIHYVDISLMTILSCCVPWLGMAVSGHALCVVDSGSERDAFFIYDHIQTGSIPDDESHFDQNFPWEVQPPVMTNYDLLWHVMAYTKNTIWHKHWFRSSHGLGFPTDSVGWVLRVTGAVLVKVRTCRSSVRAMLVQIQKPHRGFWC